jgi:hypothetical protein
MKTPIQPASKTKRAAQPAPKAHTLALESAVHHSPTHPPGSSPTTSTPSLSGKRKASTTHPYSQSEAFANRHHHCERTDELDRGIWTYFGPGGTKEAPTVAGKKEMYLRCDHDDCMRIDWKTVHGLQCHIVKNHGIPKGTIGSLELALEKYGVEVQEIEDHEKKHGLGSAGTIAEKGPRGRPRTRPSNEIVMPRPSGPTSAPVAANLVGTPAKYTPATRPKPSAPVVLFPNLAARSPSGGYVQDDIVYSEEESDGDDSSTNIKHSARTATRKVSESEHSTPFASKTGGDDDLRQSIPRSASWRSPTPPVLETLKPTDFEPRPTSSTAVAPDYAPPPAESLTSPSTKLPLHSITQAPMGTATQRLVSIADNVNARLEAADPDFVATATPDDSDAPSQTQHQAQPQTESQDTTVPNTKNTSTSRPRGGTERRVPASERWEWATIDDDNNSSTATKNNGTTTTTTLTKAQQELQGIDGSADGDGDEGGGNGPEDGNGIARSPAIARYSARKKTRRRVDV